VTRRRRIVLLALAVAALAALLAVRWLLQPDNLVPLILSQAEQATGLEITARGESDLRLRGTPQLVLREVTARMPGAPVPILEADRVLVSVPWSTLRSRGSDTTARRLEFDAPVVRLEQLRQWLASRPPSTDPVPSITRGIEISDGSLLADDWALRDLDANVPELDPGKPLRAALSGRFEADGLAAPFEAALAMQKPSLDGALGIAGEVFPAAAGWKSQATIRLSGILRDDAGQLRLQSAVLGANVRYVVDGEPSQFALGLAGTARLRSGQLELRPLAVALRGRGAIPDLDARGDLSAGETLDSSLEGQVASWPEDWPALPQPLDSATGPIPFSLQYEGPMNLTGIATLQVQRDTTRLQSRFRLPQVTNWLAAADRDSPLPPMTGTISIPRLEISGAVLEGVQVQLQDPDVDAGEPVQ
jgi:hypothetical protein